MSVSVVESHVWDVVDSGAGAHLRPGASSVPRFCLAAGLRGLSTSDFCDEVARLEMPSSSLMERAERAEALFESVGGDRFDGRVRVVLGSLFGHVTDELLGLVRVNPSLVGDEIDAGCRGFSDIREYLMLSNADLEDDAAEAVVSARVNELASDRDVRPAVYVRAFPELVSDLRTPVVKSVTETVTVTAAESGDDGGESFADEVMRVLAALAAGAEEFAERVRRRAELASGDGGHQRGADGVSVDLSM